ncbi:MAG: hypothetical protein HSCHL_0538 [Hydrogenibacillus schlegelii]|uniref:Uncharacterized protein n=1 Tax=Hydrogenibacillus schlegelii TaxID=1484 RepID=A0A2T5GDJ9_HYDSH|nr:MAG: hypothetical protein HSCHL_0538 [Hydrogenibacillus schlegelii]
MTSSLSRFGPSRPDRMDPDRSARRMLPSPKEWARSDSGGRRLGTGAVTAGA